MKHNKHRRPKIRRASRPKQPQYSKTSKTIEPAQKDFSILSTVFVLVAVLLGVGTLGFALKDVHVKIWMENP